MNMLMKQLMIINLATVGKEARRKQMEAEKDLDEFDRLRKQLGRDLKDTRQQLAERNELLNGSPDGNEATVRATAEVRTKLGELNKGVDTLTLLLEQQKAKVEKRREKGKEITPEVEAQLVTRAEVIDLARQHIDECKKILRSVRNGKGKLAGERGSRFLTNDPTKTDLPDIEGELGTELKAKDNFINSKLDQISEAVGVLGAMANDMHKELDLQERIIAEIDRDVDKANNQLETINARMKKVLAGVQKADNFCITVVFICIILAIAGFLYNQYG
ncbi:hypothetical protein PROFUN_07192 [Planoprotostelium fungivorum]|uniref:t-SNARE coiled-coil homology domain-containing protein n=1 Tax=Planoprotostelium fungivorum TaxID=1890364 RepID=A0A2P6NMD1_9EUKA|nr:hypothetical protein PROFUN_07192 [Planoprotostelium fungivorum]